MSWEELPPDADQEETRRAGGEKVCSQRGVSFLGSLCCERPSKITAKMFFGFVYP